MGLSKGLSSGSLSGLSSESPPGPPRELSSGLSPVLPSEQPLGCYRGCLTLGPEVGLGIRVQLESRTTTTPLEWRLGSRYIRAIAVTDSLMAGQALAECCSGAPIAVFCRSLGPTRATAGDWWRFAGIELVLCVPELLWDKSELDNDVVAGSGIRRSPRNSIRTVAHYTDRCAAFVPNKTKGMAPRVSQVTKG